MSSVLKKSILCFKHKKSINEQNSWNLNEEQEKQKTLDINIKEKCIIMDISENFCLVSYLNTDKTLHFTRLN